jgi:hypothetical protein
VVTGLLRDSRAASQMAGKALARGKPFAAREIVSHLLTLQP